VSFWAKISFSPHHPHSLLFGEKVLDDPSFLLHFDSQWVLYQNQWTWVLVQGDLGIMDEKGYVYILDRAKDMIISGGDNIYSREIEDVIVKNPAVHEVAVIGVPDEIWGEAVKAIVALKPGQKATEIDIITYCKQHLASYKKPKSVEFIAEIPQR
jgi:acyl-CoA synthetase (AMP-forming)/AMP-acid ligase II